MAARVAREPEEPAPRVTEQPSVWGCIAAAAGEPASSPPVEPLPLPLEDGPPLDPPLPLPKPLLLPLDTPDPLPNPPLEELEVAPEDEPLLLPPPLLLPVWLPSRPRNFATASTAQIFSSMS